MGSTNPRRDSRRRRRPVHVSPARSRRASLTAFVDSSALVALFGREEAHAEVRGALAALGPVVSSRLTYVEVGAAVGAARRGRRITAARYLRARSELAWFWENVDVVELDGTIAIAAVGVSERFALRSYDSIQLASALEQDDEGLTMIALDARLRRAATEVGLSVAP